MPVEAVTGVLASRQCEVDCAKSIGSEMKPPAVAVGVSSSDEMTASMSSPCVLNMSCVDDLPLEQVGAERVCVEQVISMSDQC